MFHKPIAESVTEEKIATPVYEVWIRHFHRVDTVSGKGRVLVVTVMALTMFITVAHGPTYASEGERVIRVATTQKFYTTVSPDERRYRSNNQESEK